MNKFFNNNPKMLPVTKPENFRKKRQSILTYIGGKLYANNIIEELPLPKI